MFFDQRILLSDNGVLTDVSSELSDFRTGSKVIPIVAAEDYIYIGTLFPWAARYFEVTVPNALDSVMSVELYNGNTWVSAVDKFDLTAVAGKSLAQSGFIRFLRDRDNGSWALNAVSDEISELAGTTIYDLYWMRLKWSADLSLTTAISYIGQKFSDDNALYSRYPDLNQAALKLRFKAGKTTWDEQSYMAAETIISDLKNRRMVLSADQVLDPWKFERASIHKTAEIIYGGFGDAYKEITAAAKAEYIIEMNKNFKNLDVSGDGTLSRGERAVSFGRLTRNGY